MKLVIVTAVTAALAAAAPAGAQQQQPGPHLAGAFASIEAARQLLLDAAQEEAALRQQVAQLQAQVQAKDAAAKEPKDVTVADLTQQVATLKAELEKAKLDGQKAVDDANAQCGGPRH